jgi:hypothetical protein
MAVFGGRLVRVHWPVTLKLGMWYTESDHIIA